MQDREGYVFGSPSGLARISALPIESVLAALKRFQEPDKYSADLGREPEREGRRIEEVPGGWRVLNGKFYRSLADAEERRALDAERQRSSRENRKKASRPVTVGHGRSQKIPHAESESESESESHADAESDSDPKRRKKRSPRRERPSIPDDLKAIPGFAELWEERIQALPSRKRPTPRGEAEQFNEVRKVLARDGAAAVIAAIHTAINRAWTGFEADWLDNGRKPHQVSGLQSRPPLYDPERDG